MNSSERSPRRQRRGANHKQSLNTSRVVSLTFSLAALAVILSLVLSYHNTSYTWMRATTQVEWTYLPSTLVETVTNMTEEATTLAGEFLSDSLGTASTPSPYAFAYVIGGCNPDRPSYRSYIFNVLVATRIFRQHKSRANVVVFIQMSYESEAERLPDEDVRILRAMNIRIKYIPKSQEENFFQTMLDKFRILGLTEYRRVLFMDGDVMPTRGLDYLFEMSDGPNAVLQPNLVVTGREEPANGGFFMLKPEEGDLERIRGIIQQRKDLAATLDHPHFDQVVGWGHKIEPPDKWETTGNSGTNYTFWAAFADQGLLYHWTKYTKKSVSIAYKNKQIKNYAALPNGTISLQSVSYPFEDIPKPIRCWNRICNMHPQSDYVHFTGRAKPWFRAPPADLSEKNSLDSASNFWYYNLGILNEELQLGLNFSDWKTGSSQRPLLGMYPKYDYVLTANPDLSGAFDDDAEIAADPDSSVTSIISDGISSVAEAANSVVESAVDTVTAILPDVQVTFEEDNGTGPLPPSDRPRYCYAFVIGGCNPEKPAYRNYIYNIAIATRILRDAGSKADVLTFFQMSSKSNSTELPEQDQELLRKMDVKTRYIPKSKQENFFRTMLDKFRILGLTEYRRVLFMDGDIMPLSNFDFLFELSDGPDAVLKPNLVVAGTKEPANGGFFMLSPAKGELEEMDAIIQRRQRLAHDIPYPYFNETEGWGHVIQPPDRWELQGPRTGTLWKFWAAFADQGLLYHWVKYAKKSVSIVRGSAVHNFGALSNGTVVLENIFRPFENMTDDSSLCFDKNYCHHGAPRSLYGNSKPWMQGIKDYDFSEAGTYGSGRKFWFYRLKLLNDDLNLGLDLENWRTGKQQRPSLGMYPLYGAVLTSNTSLLT